MKEKWQRHAPTALAADAPVRPAGNHVAQPCLAVFGVKRGFFDGRQRQLAQRRRGLVFGEHPLALIHADEPLRSSAVDHRRLVAPAMRITVGDGGACEKAVRIAQDFDDLWTGLPDIHAAKQRQLRRILAIALHRVQDIGQRHAMGDATVEVFDAIGGGGVHQTGAVVGGGVVGQVDRRRAVITGVHIGQRMLEPDVGQRLARRSCQYCADQLVTLQA